MAAGGVQVFSGARAGYWDQQWRLVAEPAAPAMRLSLSPKLTKVGA